MSAETVLMGSETDIDVSEFTPSGVDTLSDAEWEAVRDKLTAEQRAQREEREEREAVRDEAKEFLLKQAREKRNAELDAILSKGVGLATIGATEYPPIRWIVKDILPTGFAWLGAPTKVGKTTIALQLASAVAIGIPFLGSADYPTQKMEVLYFSLQLSERQIKERCEAMSILLDNGVTVLGQCLRGAEALELVARHVELHPACGLVIVDMLEQTREVDLNYEHSYSGNTKEISAWQNLAERLNIAILALTHDKKSPTEDYVSAQISSVGKVGSAAVILSLRRPRNENEATLCGTGWDIRDFEIPLLFGERGYEILSGTTEQVYRSPERREIVDLLTDAERPMRLKELAEATGKKETAVHYLLTRLLKAGSVVRTAHGAYALRESTELTEELKTESTENTEDAKQETSNFSDSSTQFSDDIAFTLDTEVSEDDIF